MEPIRVCGSLWSHRVRRVCAPNGDSTHAAVAGPGFDAAGENILACLGHLCAGVKLDLSTAPLAQLLEPRRFFEIGFRKSLCGHCAVGEISLTPCFSGVLGQPKNWNRFSGFILRATSKPLKRLQFILAFAPPR